MLCSDRSSPKRLTIGFSPPRTNVDQGPHWAEGEPTAGRRHHPFSVTTMGQSTDVRHSTPQFCAHRLGELSSHPCIRLRRVDIQPYSIKAQGTVTPDEIKGESTNHERVALDLL